MIKDRQSLSMTESEEYIKDNESSVELSKFIKKFAKLDIKKAKELKKKIEELNLMKIKSDYTSKIIDILPENAEDLNKIFVDINLDENETQKILDTVKEFIK
jgi:DNA-directed RNA polymerase subunit F